MIVTINGTGAYKGYYYTVYSRDIFIVHSPFGDIYTVCFKFDTDYAIEVTFEEYKRILQIMQETK